MVDLNIGAVRGIYVCALWAMAGIWRETGAHLASCITLVYFVTVAYKFDHRILNAQVYFDALAPSAKT